MQTSRKATKGQTLLLYPKIISFVISFFSFELLGKDVLNIYSSGGVWYSIFHYRFFLGSFFSSFSLLTFKALSWPCEACPARLTRVRVFCPLV